MSKFRIPKGTEIEYYIINPLSPTMKMILPDEYRLECDPEWDIYALCSRMFAHAFNLQKKLSLEVYPLFDIKGMEFYIEYIHRIMAKLIYTLIIGCDAHDVPYYINRVFREYYNNEISLRFTNINNESICVRPNDEKIKKYGLMLDALPFRFGSNECMYGEFKVILYGLNKNAPTRLPDNYDLYLSTDMNVYDILTKLIDHIKNAERVYNTSIYPFIIDPTEEIEGKIWRYISYCILKVITDMNGDEIPEDLIVNCVGSTVVYDTSRKCMGYQDPNAIIGFRFAHGDSSDEYDVISYRIKDEDDGAVLSDAIKDLDILMRFLPYTTNRIRLTKEDMKSII